MADRDFPRIGSYGWRQMMQWGWGIFKLDGDWFALDASNKAVFQFTTHAEATAYVRSQIDKA